ncbi:SRPBCC domain-containing protein [Ruania halotolerans]|uniref:SRPBCC domain-containing protein n=1 Tax=Ruania halotolerans TaxID=2897773 RepID=UPI001E41727E|nr:SRPBCC domain-containing protein [Ruania halotolerans]UFU05418.1 SRPBCC domain-containing protein [Ruania halotolerans]
MNAAIDPALDLVVHRLIRAPRHDLWRAWTDPALVAQWWIPAPSVARVDLLEVRPGGGFVTHMSENGHDYVPHTDSVFIAVDEGHRLVFTNAVNSNWRPALPEPVAMTAEIVLDDHPEGTDYRAIVRHGEPGARSRHEELGFFEGWGSVTAALATLVESGAAS